MKGLFPPPDLDLPANIVNQYFNMSKAPGVGKIDEEMIAELAVK